MMNVLYYQFSRVAIGCVNEKLSSQSRKENKKILLPFFGDIYHLIKTFRKHFKESSYEAVK
jgi:hypothetical protein